MSDPFPVSNGIKQGCVLAPTSSPWCSLPRCFLHSSPQILASPSATDVMTDSLIWDVCRPLCATSSLQTSVTLQPWMKQTCHWTAAKAFDHKPAEDRGVAAACTRICSSEAEHGDQGHKARQRGVLQVPGEHNDFNLHHGQRSVKQTGYSRCFHWQVVDTSMGKAGNHSTHWAAGVQGNCYLFSALWLWDLDALQKSL